MRSWRGLHPVRRPLPRVVATIGVFDGIHRGHQRLLRLAVRRARALRAASVAVTFDPHPQHVLRPSTARPLLTTLDERLQLIAAYGLDVAWVIPFTRALARRSPDAFFTGVLRRSLGLRELVVGENFACGRNRVGTVEWLRRAGRAVGVRVHAVPTLCRDGVRVSSSRVRSAIEAGALAVAQRWLGRPHRLIGDVVHGRARGRRLGCPTANLHLRTQVLPPDGVYVVRVTIGGRPRRWGGVLNLGRRPTFHETRRVAEAHLFGFRGDLYGSTLAVQLLARLRPERRFPSAAALTAQIARDLRTARALLRHWPRL